MRYISHYEEYPIYEPAEGGYYYPGNQLVAMELYNVFNNEDWSEYYE